MLKQAVIQPEQKAALLSQLVVQDYARYLGIFPDYGFTVDEYCSATTRVSMTDVERIILMRWLSGITGRLTAEALGINRSAMQIILQQARLIVLRRLLLEKNNSDCPRPDLLIGVDELGISQMTANGLRSASITSLFHLSIADERTLRGIFGFGPLAYAEVTQAMQAYGLTLTCEAIPDDIMSKSLEALDMGARKMNALVAAGVWDVRSLVSLPRGQVGEMKGVGDKGLHELEVILKKFGLSFGMSMHPNPPIQVTPPEVVHENTP